MNTVKVRIVSENISLCHFVWNGGASPLGERDRVKTHQFLVLKNSFSIPKISASLSHNFVV
jgi:hypothetical protein